MQPLVERTARESAYLMLDLPVGVIGFTVMVTGLATGASLAITLAGIPLLAGALLLARHAARIERARASRFLGVELAPPPERPSADSWTGRVVGPIRDREAWKATGYFIAMLPAGTATFAAAVAWWGTALFLLALPLFAWALPADSLRWGDIAWTAPEELAASTVVGLVLLAATPFVIHTLTRVDRALLRLVGSA
jgi:hypothetical protein